MSEKKYLLINTTVKEPYMLNGKDARTALEKVGHAVKINDSDILGPGETAVVDQVTGSQIKLRNEGYISIEECDGIGQVLQNQAYSKGNTKQSRKVAIPSGAKVSQMGDNVVFETEHKAAGKSSISADPSVVKSKTKEKNAASKQRNNKTTRKS